MALFERVAGTESGQKRIPGHCLQAIMCEFGRNAITGTQAQARLDLAIKVPGTLRQVDIDEITALFNLIPQGSTTAIRLNRIEFLNLIADVMLQLDRRVITANDARTRLGLPTI